MTYLDSQVIAQWVLPRFNALGLKKRTAIDIGAGKGRMLKCLSERFDRVTAVEPNDFFYSALEAESRRYNNVVPFHGTLSALVSEARIRCEFAYVSGVTPYLDEEELRAFLRDVGRCLTPTGLMCIREMGAYGQSQRKEHEINRTREDMCEVARLAGFECIRFRHAYPTLFYARLEGWWPSRVTRAIRYLATHPTLFVAWALLARMDLSKKKGYTFFVYLFRRVPGRSK